VSRAAWGGYADSMSRLYCDTKTVPHAAPESGMPLVGWAWACLSDLFFHELATIEANVDRLLAKKREEATAPLQQLMTSAERRIATAATEIDEHPSPPLLLRELTWRLHQVEVEGIGLRIQELEAQRAAGDGTAAFLWLLTNSPKVKRPAGGSARTVSAFSGAVITAKLGGEKATAKVQESLLPRLARELHDAHFRIEQSKLQGADVSDANLRDAEADRASALSQMAVEARGNTK
jgi:hypothetical protein